MYDDCISFLPSHFRQPVVPAPQNTLFIPCKHPPQKSHKNAPKKPFCSTIFEINSIDYQ